MRAVIATGAGRYADQWHPFAATSRRLKSVLEDAGFAVVIDEDLDGAMTRLAASISSWSTREILGGGQAIHRPRSRSQDSLRLSVEASASWACMPPLRR